ncbi:MAG: hypothetical protein ACTTH5_08540 [Wolinella sp.]
MVRENGVLFVDMDAISLEYGSVASFLREENISRPVFDSLKFKKSFSFKSDSKARQAFLRLRELGYVKPSKERRESEQIAG